MSPKITTDDLQQAHRERLAECALQLRQNRAFCEMLDRAELNQQEKEKWPKP